MVYEFQKGNSTQISEHFNSAHFDCRCTLTTCVFTLVDAELVGGLECLWHLSNGLWITSGFRCQTHNRMVGGKRASLHQIGKAADVQSHTKAPDLANSAETVPIFKLGGIGRAKTFVHLDVRGYAARWNY